VLNDDPSDDRHGLTDQGAWSQYIVHKLHRSFVAPHGGTSSLPPGDWQRLIELVREAPTFLSMTVGGNHFFLVGEVGARAIARCILQLKARVRLLTEEIAAYSHPMAFAR
jgi:hypothetical protein